jgi:hypothetical protein
LASRRLSPSGLEHFLFKIGLFLRIGDIFSRVACLGSELHGAYLGFFLEGKAHCGVEGCVQVTLHVFNANIVFANEGFDVG